MITVNPDCLKSCTKPRAQNHLRWCSAPPVLLGNVVHRSTINNRPVDPGQHQARYKKRCPRHGRPNVLNHVYTGCRHARTSPLLNQFWLSVLAERCQLGLEPATGLCCYTPHANMYASATLRLPICVTELRQRAQLPRTAHFVRRNRRCTGLRCSLLSVWTGVQTNCRKQKGDMKRHVKDSPIRPLSVQFRAWTLRGLPDRRRPPARRLQRPYRMPSVLEYWFC